MGDGSLNAITEPAFAKINLALHVLGRRADGYHELDSIVAFASVGDLITVKEARETVLEISGPFAAAVPANVQNIALQAHAKLKLLYQSHGAALPPVHIHLVKNLPVASGIGGGSADAAAVLRALLKLFPANLSDDEIAQYALQIGADVPVCFNQKTCRMQGVGEKLTFPKLDLPRAIVLANPNLPLSTPDVFRALGLSICQSYNPPLDPKNQLTWRNDLTAAAIKCRPEIAQVLAALKPCRMVRMTGSGATCFGLFENIEEAENLAKSIAGDYPAWWVQAARLG